MTGNTEENARILRPMDLINPKFSLGFLDSPRDLDSLETFSELWHKDYLQPPADRNQLCLAKKQESGNRPKVGDVVLIQIDNTPRSNWPLGLVVQVNESADGTARFVKLKTGKQKLVDRCTSQLIPLEITTDARVQTTRKREPKKPTRIQAPRGAKSTTTR
ncbi:unnamed protein product [Heligmosomoides polygyrus]|uniref:DUF5641 domain-containing protein n=1 Tax=Heligmosomoides polygyrus TaxID=6339 RepID=A0A183FHP9_HELPZ|nr:unnamed protein product [Heligmosomoides polygyrus]